MNSVSEWAVCVCVCEMRAHFVQCTMQWMNPKANAHMNTNGVNRCCSSVCLFVYLFIFHFFLPTTSNKFNYPHMHKFTDNSMCCCRCRCLWPGEGYQLIFCFWFSFPHSYAFIPFEWPSKQYYFARLFVLLIYCFAIQRTSLHGFFFVVGRNMCVMLYSYYYLMFFCLALLHFASSPIFMQFD